MLRKYEDIVVRNGPAIAQLEQTLQSVRYLLPGRVFTDNNWDLVAGELLQSVLTLLRAYHDGIYHRHFPNAVVADNPIYSSPDKTSRTLMWLLNWLSATQVPLEMLVERFLALRDHSSPQYHPHPYRSLVCVLVETVKALARLALWARRNARVCRSFLPHGVVRPTSKIATDEELITKDDQAKELTTKDGQDNKDDHISEDGENVPPMQGMRLMYQSLRHCCPTRVRDFVDMQMASSSAPDATIEWHELVGIVRPVVTALSFHHQQQMQGDKRAWLWWLFNVLVEGWAVYPDLVRGVKQQLFTKSDSQAEAEEEDPARIFAILLNLLREPMYSAGPRQAITSVSAFLSAWTLLRPMGTSLDAYRRLIEDVYFATSHS